MLPPKRISLVLILVSLLCSKASLGQEVAGCFPVSERTTEVGCWVLSNAPIGQLSKTAVYWYLEAYENRAAAETDKGPHGTVVESLGKIWLMTIDEPGRKPPSKGKRVAEIGPLAISTSEKHSAQYMDAVFTSGMTVGTHLHGGPEAWYTLSGDDAGLLVKTYFDGIETQRLECEDFAGVKTARHIDVLKDGKLAIRIHVTDVTPAGTIPAKTFEVKGQEWTRAFTAEVR